MAGRQHETRPDQETGRKGQISDEPGKHESLRTIGSSECSFVAQHSYPKNQPDSLKIEEAKKIDVHFYNLSIMNEANKVIFI